MDRIEVEFIWLEHGRGLDAPRHQTAGAAGVDLPAALGFSETLILNPGEYRLVPTGLAIALPMGYEAQVRPRSGLAAKFGVTVLNAPGTVDADYRGEIKVQLINHGPAPVEFRRGDRIAQLVIARVTQADFIETKALDTTERGDKGHGSTGV